MPHTYTLQHHTAPHVVYLKFSTSHSPCYVGVTAKSIPGREGTRKRKLRQINKDKLVQTELSLRWWDRHPDSYATHCTVAVYQATNKHQASLKEQVLIAKWQPELNYHWVTKLRITGNPNWSLPTPVYTCQGRKLWQKVRKRHCTTKTPWMPISTNAGRHDARAAWSILMDVSSKTLRSYRRLARLRGHHHTDQHIYALSRQANSLEEPMRTRTKALLRSVLNFRHQSTPPSSRPLAISWLAHPEFQSQVKQWMRATLRHHSDVAVPYHLPPTTLLQAKNPAVKQVLHNWKQWSQQSIAERMRCACKHHPDQSLHSEHLALALTDFIQLPRLQHLLANSASDSYYPAKAKYLAKTTQQVRQWIKHYQLPPAIYLSWQRLVHSIWPLHLAAIQANPHYISFQDLQYIKNRIAHLVIQCEDHQPDKLMAYCPHLYHQLTTKTFDDGKVFKQHPGSAAMWVKHCQHLLSSDLRKRYSWAFHWQRPMPSSYIFPKAKKAYTTARPIIAYTKTYAYDMLRVLAKILWDVCCRAYPDNFYKHDVHQTIKKLQKYFATVDNDAKLVMTNDDLVGFFTSVPQDRIIQSVQHMLWSYLRRHSTSQPVDQINFTTDVQTKDSRFRTFRGKIRRQQQVRRSIRLVDLIPLTQAALDYGFFTSCNAVYSQIRGSPIGSPASPAICHITVAYMEQMWVQSWNIQTTPTSTIPGCFITRYVDNRFTITHSSNQTPIGPQLLCVAYRP